MHLKRETGLRKQFAAAGRGGGQNQHIGIMAGSRAQGLLRLDLEVYLRSNSRAVRARFRCIFSVLLPSRFSGR